MDSYSEVSGTISKHEEQLPFRKAALLTVVADGSAGGQLLGHLLGSSANPVRGEQQPLCLV